MAPDLNRAAVDEEAEDPPETWLAVAVLGIVLAVMGLVATTLSLTGTHEAVVSTVPALSILLDLSLPVLVVGIGLFVLAMTEWDPDLSE